ncbi:MAG: hypothetical protein K8T89_22070 [Planctomycetes bacterium]|nr:hypothetical protein [Planctomycetota bacterium]
MPAIYEDDNCALLVAPWGASPFPSLFGIKKRYTGTGRTEVHIRSPESGYLEYSLNVATDLHETHRNFTFLLADWTGSGVPDLWAIKKWATGTNSTEVHIYSGDSNFSQAVFHGGTALHETGDNFEFDVLSAGLNAPPDLVAIKREATGTQSTEMHVLSGASGFQQFKQQTGTALHETGSARDWRFLVTDWDRNGVADLAAFSPANGGEIHVLRGPQYQNFIQQTVVTSAQERQIIAPEADDARWDAIVSCGNAAANFLGVLGANAALYLYPPVGAGATIVQILAFMGTRAAFLADMIGCARDITKYKREAAPPSGRGGEGTDTDPHPESHPHPAEPTQPPGPVEPPDPMGPPEPVGPPEPPEDQGDPVDPPDDPADPGDAPLVG